MIRLSSRRALNLKVLLWVLSILLPIQFAATGCSQAPAAKEEQTYPSKPIEMIMPWAPGGSIELPARVVTEALAREWKQPINIVNKPGGNTIPATLELMKAKPDGYTVQAENPASTAFQVLQPNLPFKMEERTFICNAIYLALVFAVKADSPWKDLRDVAAAVKANPEKFRWGSLGGFSVADLGLKQFLRDCGVDISRTKPVNFKGSAEAATALAGGHIDFAAGGTGTFVSYLGAGTLRLVGVSGEVRLKAYPDLLTGPEQGFRGVTASAWIGFSGPPGLPKYVVDKWTDGVKKVLQDPAVIDGLAKFGNEPLFISSDEWKREVLRQAEDARALLGTGQ